MSQNESDAQRMLRRQKEWEQQQRDEKRRTSPSSSADNREATSPSSAAPLSASSSQQQSTAATSVQRAGLKGWQKFLLGGVALAGLGIGSYAWLKSNTQVFASAAERCDRARLSASYSDAKSWKPAVVPCREAVEQAPNDAKALANLAKVEYALGNKDEGLKFLRRAAAAGDGEALRELAIETESAEALKQAIAAFGREATSGNSYALYQLAEASLWSNDFNLKQHGDMLADGTYRAFTKAASSKSNLVHINNLAREIADPEKPPRGENNWIVANSLFHITSAQNDPTGTTQLARQAIRMGEFSSKRGDTDGVAWALDEGERLARLALKQVEAGNGNGFDGYFAYNLLEQIKEVRQRPARMWGSIFSALLALDSGGTKAQGDQEQSRFGYDPDELERERRDANCRTAGWASAMGDEDTASTIGIFNGC